VENPENAALENHMISAMPHRRPFTSKHAQRRKPQAPPENMSGRYDAPPDPVIDIPGLAIGSALSFDSDIARRLMRRDVHPKEAFTARGDGGAFWRVSVKELGPAGGTGVPYERMTVSPEATLEITLACAVLGRQRMLFVAQKATELGVARIVPLITEHSVPPKDFSHEKAHAWPGQIVRAAKQCRRGSLPELVAPVALALFVESAVMAQADECLVLDNVGGPSSAIEGNPRKVVLLIGPEGGFSDAERTLLDGKAKTWKLGGRVLRAETAVLVGLSAMQLLWGDYRAPGAIS
jgi:16S rRNA (uracil1498-N3)-methyltransferase